MRTFFEIILGAIATNPPPYNPADLRVLARNAQEFREKIQDQINIMRHAVICLQRARIDIINLQGMLRILVSGPIEHIELIEHTCGEIQIEERRATAALTKHDDAKAKVAHMQSLLETASRLNPSICPMSKPHNCQAAKPASKSGWETTKHLFWMVVSPPKKSPRRTGPLGYRVENHRVIAFHDVQERTNSTFGNGRSRLRIVTDVDGDTATHECEDSHSKLDDHSSKWQSAAKDSRTLLRLRFEARKEHYFMFCFWFGRMGKVHDQLLASPRLLVPPEISAVRKFDENILRALHTEAAKPLQQDPSWRWA